MMFQLTEEEQKWYVDFCSWQFTYNPIADLEKAFEYILRLEEIKFKDLMVVVDQV